MSSIPPAEPDFLLPSQTSAPSKRQCTGTPDDPGYVPGVEYDQWNRYLLPTPGGDPAELEPWTRVTTLTGMLTNSEGLRVWSERNIVEGIGLRADLRAAITADPTSKAVQDEVIAVAKVVTRDEQAARWGRAVHRAIESLSMPPTSDARTDRTAGMPDPSEPFGRDVIAAMECLKQNGITVRMVEALVIHQTLGYAGRLDALWEVTLPDGRVVLRVGDVKTGKGLHKPEKRHPMGAQLGGYVNATHTYHPETRAFRPFAELGVDLDRGYVLSVREGTAQLYELDLVTGWQRMLTAVKLHRDRKSSVDMLPVGRPVTIEDPALNELRTELTVDASAFQQGAERMAAITAPAELARDDFRPVETVVVQNVGTEHATADVPAHPEPERSPSGRARRACSKCRKPGHTAKRCPGGEALTADPQSDAQAVQICPHAHGWTSRPSDGAWVCVDCGRPSEATVKAMRTGAPLPTSATATPEQTALPPTAENGATVARLDPAPAVPSAPPRARPIPDGTPTLLELITEARSQEALGQLWQANQASWTQEHTDAAQRRVATGLPVLDASRTVDMSGHEG
jgi:hypothetical protein